MFIACNSIILVLALTPVESSHIQDDIFKELKEIKQQIGILNNAVENMKLDVSSLKNEIPEAIENFSNILNDLITNMKKDVQDDESKAIEAFEKDQKKEGSFEVLSQKLGLSKDQLEGAVLLTTTGVSAEYRGYGFGLYLKDTSEPDLYYQIDQYKSEPSNFIYRGSDPDSGWYVNSKQNDRGYLANIKATKSVPTSGWEYSFDGDWLEDNGITVTKINDVDPATICTKVKIDGDGSRGKFWSHGIFTAMGTFAAGRMVYFNSETSKVLRVDGEDFFKEPSWYVCDDSEDCDIDDLHSGGGANSMNPADPVAFGSMMRWPERNSWGFTKSRSRGGFLNVNTTIKCLD